MCLVWHSGSCEAAGHISCTVRKQRKLGDGAQFTFPFLLSPGAQSTEWLPMFKKAPPISVNPYRNSLPNIS